jgi:protein SCO1/2
MPCPGARQRAAAAAVTWVALLSGCSASDETRQYELKGQILAVRPEQREVLIKHGDIQNFMPGMTMPFKVRDAALLEDKSPGDLVTAQLVVANTEAWLAAIEKTGAAPLEEPAAAIPPAAFVRPLIPGDHVPATALQDAMGGRRSLDDWRGFGVLVTFTYVRCPLPQFCPLMDRRFAAIQHAVAADARLAGKIRLLSVSFDPAHDTPAALHAHATRLGADPDVWRFATAPPDVVDRFAARFGVNVIREADGTITHNLRTAAIAPDGRVVKIYDGSDWTPEQVVDDLAQAVAR